MQYELLRLYNKNVDGFLYVGVINDYRRRLYEHNTKQGARFTKKGNYKIMFIKEYETLADARKREIQIKKWSRSKKEKLIDGTWE